MIKKKNGIDLAKNFLFFFVFHNYIYKFFLVWRGRKAVENGGFYEVGTVASNAGDEKSGKTTV